MARMEPQATWHSNLATEPIEKLKLFSLPFVFEGQMGIQPIYLYFGPSCVSVQPNGGGGGGVDSNPEAAAVNPSTVEKDVLSEDDKKFLSSSEVIKPATASKQWVISNQPIKELQWHTTYHEKPTFECTKDHHHILLFGLKF